MTLCDTCESRHVKGRSKKTCDTCTKAKQESEKKVQISLVLMYCEFQTQ